MSADGPSVRSAPANAAHLVDHAVDPSQVVAAMRPKTGSQFTLSQTQMIVPGILIRSADQHLRTAPNTGPTHRTTPHQSRSDPFP